MNKIKLGINAVRIKSGGGVSHIKGILEAYNQNICSFQKIHLWCNNSISKQLCNYQWLKIHVPNVSNKSTIRQLYWERFTFKKLGKQVL